MFLIQIIAHSLEGMRQRFKRGRASGDEQAAEADCGWNAGEENKGRWGAVARCGELVKVGAIFGIMA
jgi:hypothetical protein